MKRFRLLLLCAAILLLTASCGDTFSQEYLSVTAHDEQYAVDEESDALTAENYLGLKNAILSFVENHTEYGTIRIYHYDGDVESDLADAAYEVAKSDPLGAYAVDYMTHDCTLIVSYYEIHLYITFARTQEEIDAVERVNNISALRAAFEQGILDGTDTLTLRVSSYSEQDFDALARECYLANADRITEQPSVSVQLYPGTGVQRIIQIDFDYTTDAETRAQAQEELTAAITRVTDGVTLRSSETERFNQLSAELLELLTDAEPDDNALVYDVLCNGRMSSESVALTMQMLAEDVGLSCVTVSGRRNNSPYAWNVVTMDGASYHVDLMRDVTEGGETAQRYSDAELETDYSWDRDSVPACDTSPTEQGNEPPEEPEPEEG
jgi:hypothetical protein